MQEFVDQLLSQSPHPVALVPVVIAAYLLGNINPAILLGRLYGVDVRSEGSGNAGTTNALRTIGKRAGAIVFIVDVLKGVIVALLPTILLSHAAGLVCGVAVILGHMWPVCYGFRGGKGVATTFGVLISIVHFVALIPIVIVIGVVVMTRMVSLGVCLAALATIPAGSIYGSIYPLWLAVIAALLLVKHADNIVRIFKGEEKKLTFGTKDKSLSGVDPDATPDPEVAKEVSIVTG